jgi:hypothetical protein
VGLSTRCTRQRQNLCDAAVLYVQKKATELGRTAIVYLNLPSDSTQPRAHVYSLCYVAPARTSLYM